jgi:hypothetical protein
LEELEMRNRQFLEKMGQENMTAFQQQIREAELKEVRERGARERRAREERERGRRRLKIRRR